MKNNKVIRLTIFNECFWEKGLIYSQNIEPINKFIRNTGGISFEIIAFISLLDIIRFRKQIKKFKQEQVNLIKKIRIFPTLYLPSRLFYPRWFLMPFLFFNLFIYIIALYITDTISKRIVFYNLRSYQVSIIFTLLYKKKESLIFDPRSDMINEMISIKTWKKNSLSHKVWKASEKYILLHTNKTIFISDVMKMDILKRNTLPDNKNKYYTYYNQVDFKRFAPNNNKGENIFLYTGSLGNWNSIETYLSFFKKVLLYMEDSVLYIVTNSRSYKYEPILFSENFKSIQERVVIIKNPKFNDLPEIYSKCKYGLQLMSEPDSRLGVKYVEYIASGIIPIVNSNVRGAAEFSKNHSLGIVLDNNFNNIDKNICDKIGELKFTNLQIEKNKIKNLLDVNYSNYILKNIYC